MQEKQFTQHNMTQKQITQKTMTDRQFTRQHNSHEHSMTLSTPQPDTLRMNIPSGTIVEEQPRKIRFAYLRSWLMSLLAVIVLPIGAIFILVGTAISDELPQDWVSSPATVRSIDDTTTLYSWAVNGNDEVGTLTRDWQSYINPKASGDLAAQVSLCDIASVVMIPREVGGEFTVWYDPQAPSRHQCVPITREAGQMFVVAGWVLVVLSLWTFLRVFNRAAVKLAQDNK